MLLLESQSSDLSLKATALTGRLKRVCGPPNLGTAGPRERSIVRPDQQHNFGCAFVCWWCCGEGGREEKNVGHHHETTGQTGRDREERETKPPTAANLFEMLCTNASSASRPLLDSSLVPEVDLLLIQQLQPPFRSPRSTTHAPSRHHLASPPAAHQNGPARNRIAAVQTIILHQ